MYDCHLVFGRLGTKQQLSIAINICHSETPGFDMHTLRVLIER